MIKHCLVSILTVAVAGYSQNLFTNRDFEQPLNLGWTTTTNGGGSHAAVCSTHFNPDPDFEAAVSQISGPGMIRLGQTADVPGVNPSQVRKLEVALFDTTSGG